MTRAITSLAIAALLALGGCNKKTENPPPGGASGSTAGTAAGSGAAAGSGSNADSAAGSSSAAAASGSAAAASGSAAAAEVPTEMDFENDANAKITDKNVEAQVKALENDLNAK